MTIAIGVFGAAGRMGKMILREVLDDADLILAACAVREGSPYSEKSVADIMGSNTPLSSAPVTVSPEKLIMACDVAVDFTRPEASTHNVYVAAAVGKPIVVGTTGLTQEQVQMIKDAAAHIPIVLAANMSLGVNLLRGLVEIAAQTLDPKYDIEILEMHHRHKIDAPSGTALTLADAAAIGRQVSLKNRAVYDRKGNSGPRRRGDIGFAVLRGGDVVGEHTVLFACDGERVELTHKATDRRIFAQGALVAAKWLAEQPPGLYGVKDVLGF